MTNKEAYLSDLDCLKKEIDLVLRAVPPGKTKREREARLEAEDAAGRAAATIGCMRKDYIIVED